MRHCTLCALAALATGVVSTAGHPQPPPLLRPLDSVRVVETPTVLVSRPTAIAAAGRRILVGDGGESRVVEIGPHGEIVRTIGRKGRGPGEMINPGAVAIGGDTALFVLDGGASRLSVFDLRTGDFKRGFPLTGFMRNIAVAGPELLVSWLDEPSKTSIATLAPDGRVIRREGPIPPLGLRFPMLLGSHGLTAFHVAGGEVYAMYALSQSLYAWKRGETAVREFRVPVTRRRGVKDATFEALIRDPSRARELAYSISFPAALSVVAPGTVALLTFDPTLEGAAFTGPYHLSLVDVDRRRTCPEVEVPLPHAPMPKATLDRSTLVAVYQVAGADGGLATIVRRFAIEPASCKWERIP